MRSTLFLFVLVVALQSDAQQLQLPFSVKYFSGSIRSTDSLLIQNVGKKNGLGLPNYEITILDTAALIRPYERERERAESMIGSGFRSHTIFVDLKNQYQYFQSEPLGLDKFLVQEKYRQTAYDLINDSISVLGYTCYKAVLKAKPGNQTNSVMWYAPSLPYPISHLGFSGLPGLVLASETYNGKSRAVLIATEIKTEKRTIVKPFKGKPVTQETFFKALETLRRN